MATLIILIVCLILLIIILILFACYRNNNQYNSKNSFKSNENKITKKYYLNTSDFINNLIQIPTANLNPNSTNKSLYAGGKCQVYDYYTNLECGVCSATFLCMRADSRIFVDISNYLSFDDGLIVSWFTPSTPSDLGLDTIINSMVTECIVTSTTLINKNPYYGLTFNLIVSSNSGKVIFDFTEI